MKNIVVFVQARMGSNRLPGKVLKKVNGKELLLHQVERIKKAKTINNVVVITTSNNEDDAIFNLCEKHSIDCYRGSELDLLDRHYQAAIIYKADFVVKIGSDSPLTDSNIIDEVLSLWIKNPNKYDYVSNYHPPTFPDGLDVEGCPIEILKIAWENATQAHEREHTFPYIWDNPSEFRIGNVFNKFGNMFTSHRWTIDYPEDYDFLKNVFEFFKNNEDFKMKDILQYLNENPNVSKLNEIYNGVNWYRNVGKLKTVDRFQYKRENIPLNLTNSLNLLDEAKKVVPCASQTLSKGYTQWSVGAVPLFLESGKGCEVTDPDGNVFIDYGMGLGPFILGYSDDDVNLAIKKQLEKGTMFTLPNSLEVEASKAIIDSVPCAEMVRFGKNGSDATSAAVKLARAYTKKDLIIHCGYHGWQDWYITSTERDAGIPKVMKKLVLSLQYNDLDGLKTLISENKNKIAGLIMEPVGAIKPNCIRESNCSNAECNLMCQNNFLHEVRRITEKNNIVLIFDELFTGFRWSMGGASKYFNVIPDLACFGKALSNGMPVSCITGRREIMNMFETVFFSFSYGGETLSLAAIIATINKLKECNVHEHIENESTFLVNGINRLILEHKLEEYISIFGYPFKSVFKLSGNKDFNPLELKTLMQQECAKRGVLFIGYHLVSYSHKREHIEFTLQVYDEVFSLVRSAIKNNNLVELIEGTVVTQIFKNVGDRSIKD